MKKIFLDCGSNCGQGFEYFNKIYGDDYEYHMFEPNPNCHPILQENYGNRKNIIINKKAVSSKKGKLTFYFESDDPISWGGSLVSEHNNIFYDVNNDLITKVEVEVIDIDEYIKNLLQTYKNCEIIMKLDVESSEYDILEKLIESKTIHEIKNFYIEFHTQYMKEGENKNKFVNIENRIKQYFYNNNIEFHVELDYGNWT